jgi:cytochrome bd-type quinol oxidase subunit 2
VCEFAQQSNLDPVGTRFQTGLAPADHLEVRARTQLIAAVAAGTFGIAGLAFALFTPLHAYQDCFAMAGTDGQQVVCRGSMQSMFDESGFAAFAGMLVPAYFFAAVGVAGAKNARAASRQTRRLLWLSTAVLVSLTFVMIFSIGPFMLPGTLLALYASLLSRNGEAPAAGGRAQRKTAPAAG